MTYDSHICCTNYSELKQTIEDIINGEDDKTDVEELKYYIQELYNDGDISSMQYDGLINYIQNIKQY